MGFIQENLINPVSEVLWTYVLVHVLLGVGLHFGIRTRFAQLRHFGRMLRQVGSSRSGAEGGISSFQAFAIGLASRVGTGNIAGVAIALTLGGPGKVSAADGTFRGGPACCVERGPWSSAACAAPPASPRSWSPSRLSPTSCSRW